MASFSELILKLGSGQTLDAADLAQLRDEARAVEEAKNLVKSWVVAGSNIPIFQPPIVTIYSKILVEDITSLSIRIPQDYKHLILFASGTITTANGGNIWAQFNGDTGNNYTWQFIKGDNTTLTGNQDTADPYVALGVFGTTGAGAGVNGSFRAEFPHYNSSTFKKNVLSHAFTAEFNDLYLLGSTWQDTDPITDIEIFGTDNTLAKGTASIASGSVFSLYGLL
jgi:hypothetical protein